MESQSILRSDNQHTFTRLEAILRRDRRIVMTALVTVIVICWLYILSGAGIGMYPYEMAVFNPSAQGMGTSMQDNAGMPAQEINTSAWTPGYTMLMFLMWWLMMIAMMLPSAVPIILLHAAVTRNKLAQDSDTKSSAGLHQLIKSTTAFVCGYLVIWGAFSLAAVFAQWQLDRLLLLSPMMTTTSLLLGAGLLLAAGLWQLTPLKNVCLSHCRTPASFVSQYWSPGTRGGFVMGIKHGTYCLGCCWFLMALLFYAGVMNLIWIAGLALFVLIEKLMPGGVLIGKVIGIVLVVWGVWLGLGVIGGL